LHELQQESISISHAKQARFHATVTLKTRKGTVKNQTTACRYVA
jgi:hypothetical protein